MQLLDDLQREHERIERVLGAFRTWADGLVTGTAASGDRSLFLDFFQLYAGAFHHEREEEILFPALTMEAQLPGERGPLAVLLDDHARMAELLVSIRDAADPKQIQELVRDYSHQLWAHIDVENSVLFPECENQLRRNGVRELTGRRESQSELVVAGIGDTLVERYPPMQPDAIRGDGCVMCHAYGDTCRGLEREWWNEWEWEEMSEHVAAS